MTSMYRMIFSFLAISLMLVSSLFSQEKIFVEDEFFIQITPQAAKEFSLSVEDGIAQTGITPIDALNQKYQVRAIETALRFQPQNIQLAEKLGLTRTYLVKLPAGSSVQRVIEEYSTLDEIVYAEPNYIATMHGKIDRPGASVAELVPNDPLYANQWAHDNTGQVVPYGGGAPVGTPDTDMDTDEAWDIHTGSNTVILSILDTGVDYNHPEFSGRIAAGFDFINNDNDPMDDNGHGTSCAGIAAARGNNGMGVAGVNWECMIMPVKVLSAAGSGTYQNIADGITFAADNGARVLSLSLGGSASSITLENAVNYAFGLDCIILASRGNNNNTAASYPASYTNVVAVGALSPCDDRKSPSTCDGEFWWGSSYGNDLDFMAPGTRIYTTDIQGAGGYDPGDYFDTFNGTSAACPFAAGLAALIRSFDPGLTNAGVRQLMRDTAVDMGTPGFDSQTGYGRINALNALSGGPPPPPPGNEFHINAGGSNYTDVNGDLFVADKAYTSGDFGYVGGVGNTFSSAVSGTTDDPLYQSVRGGKTASFSYLFDGLSSGSYMVTMYFTEPFFNAAGLRIFDVLMEGNVALDNFDVFAASGGKLVAHSETIVVTVTDGQLNIDFVPVNNTYAFVSAISVVEAPPPTAGVFRINAGGTNYTDSNGDLFVADKAFTAGDFGYVGGLGNTFSGSVSGTTDDPLYQSMRGEKNSTFSYIFDALTNGDYDVTLYFMEPFFNSAGQRIFDVTVEGAVQLDNFDIIAAAGGSYVAHSESFVATVSDGQLNIEFIPVNGTHAIVSAISVSEVVAGPSQPLAEDSRLSTDAAALPEEFQLYQNYPNPFNPETTIKYQMPENMSVSLTVYDVLGRKIRTLVDGFQSAGVHQVVWDGRNDFGQQVASGIYIYKIQGENFVSVRKMTMVQ